MFKIPIYQPDLSGNEKKYVLECIDSSWISSKGKFVQEFENKFAEKIGVEHAVSVCNGTVALHLALEAIGVGKGDEVIVPTLTYVASVNSIKYTGATPIFCDSIESTWQIDPKKIEELISERTKAIMVVHLYGQPCDMKAIMDIAKKHEILVIEDCAEAFGASIGSCHVGTFGDVSTFSFFGNKTITTGEGGMLITNDPTICERAAHLKGQGLAKHREYWHDVIGYNYRMTNIAAAIGLAQLERSDLFVSKKREIAVHYRRMLEDLPLSFQSECDEMTHSYWMFSVLLRDSSLRDDLRSWLVKCGIETRPLFYPVHTMPMYANSYRKISVAERLARSGINLPSWPGLAEADIEYISKMIRRFFENED